VRNLYIPSFFRNLGNNGFSPVKAFLWSWLQETARRTAELTGNFLALSFRAVLLDPLSVLGTHLFWPFGTFLLSSVSLGDIFTFLFLNGLTLNYVILNIVLVVSGAALRLINSSTFYWSFAITDEWGVTELNFFVRCDFLVFNEAALDEVFLTFLFLLRLKVSCVSRVTLLAVGVLALNNIIIFSLLNHDNLVNTPLSSSSDRPNVKGDIVSATPLTGATSRDIFMSMGMIIMVSMVMMMVFMGSV